MPDVLKTVGRYELLREIGRGGMAKVYLARQPDLDRFVALKELSFEAGDPSLARRFLRESRLAGSLSHPNIVMVFDYFEHDGTPYIAMEYVERGSLRPYVRHLSLAQIGGVLEGVLAGLAHAEANEIVHRDLKPENLMVTSEGRVKIADFGIAKATSRVTMASFLTAKGSTVGTPAYMSPEQAMGQGIGPWTDLYSVGCISFELFTGTPPFWDSDSPMALMLRHVNEPIPAVRALAPSIDERLSDWVASLLEKKPEQRVRSANEAWEALEEAMIGLLGPRWRRQARLGAPLAEVDPASPLTPAPFEGGRDVPDAAEPTPGPATPPPHNLPPGPMTPGPIDVPVGASTPPPLNPITQGPSETDDFATYRPPRPLRPEDVEPTESELLDAAPPPAPPRSDPPPPAVPPPPAPPPPAPASPEAEHPPAAPAPQPEEAPSTDPQDTIAPRRAITEPPSPSVRAPRGRRRGVMAAVLALGIVGAAAIVLTSGDSEPRRSTSSAAPASETLQAGPLSLEAPAGWEPLQTAPDVPGVKLAGATGAAPQGDAELGAAVIGMAPESAHQPSLLPAELVDALGLRPGLAPDHREVTLAGSVRALHYAGLRPIGSERSLTVYAVPTTAGVATLACVAPDARAQAVERACAQAAPSLRVDGEKTFALGPSPEFARSVQGAFTKLTPAVAKHRRAMRKASSARRQAAAASATAAAYRTAAKALAKPEVSPADATVRRQLVRAFERAQAAFRTLSAAARRTDQSGYRGAANRAERAETAVAQALTAVRSAGYRRLRKSLYRHAPVPPLARPKEKPDADTGSSPSPPPSASPTPAPTQPPSDPGPESPPPQQQPPPQNEPTPPPIIGGD